MKIIILGAGQVGGTLAENLVGENNDITIVDKDPERLRELQDKYDLRVVQGFASHPKTLRDAGAQDADMLVAVTNSDETNMIACQIAFSLFNTPNRVARIRSPEYLKEKETAIPIRCCSCRSPYCTRRTGNRLYRAINRVPRCVTGCWFCGR